MRTILQWSLLTTLLSGFAIAQPALHLKTRQIHVDASGPVDEAYSPRLYGRGHVLLQFNQPPSSEQVAELKRRGIRVLQDVPENGLLVSVDRRANLAGLGVRFAAPVPPVDKISPLITGALSSTANGYYLIEFHPDVEMNAARGLVVSLGIEVRNNPDVASHQLLIHPQAPVKSELADLAALDEVAYIFPASAELVNGTPVRACEGALTTNGATGQLFPTYGYGWDGPGLNATTISYVFSKMTSQLPPAAAQAEIERAMAQWSSVVKVTWQPGTNPTGPRTVNILWATNEHGDGFPFDGPGGILAHTFYPAPPNPEPIAGDMHLDDSESWHIGSNTDLFSVTLHELGHALGLGHSDDPTAVMYPYYKMATTLSPIDKAAILTMYAAQDTSTPPVTPVAPPTPPVNPPLTPVTPPNPPAAPLVLHINTPAATTTASTLSLSGSATGGSTAITIMWANNHGNFGSSQSSSSAWTIAGIPLAPGSNTVTVTATSGSFRVFQSVTVARQSPPPATPGTNPGATPGSNPSDTTPPSITVTSPSTMMVSTSLPSVTISGTASDNVGVASVYWTTSTGGSGTASGIGNWTFSAPVLVGNNIVTIYARDAAGNVAWRTVAVSRH